MSLLLFKSLTKSSARQARLKAPGLVSSETNEFQRIQASRIWLLTYIALFTSLLAFFILIITQIELESSTLKRNYQKLVHELYLETLYQSKQQGLSWLTVENTLSKGVRLTIDPQAIADQSLFASARAQLNPRYLPYIRKVSELLQSLSLATFTQRHQFLVHGIESAGFEVKLLIRIEGHTDSRPLAKTALFENNVELSTFRAYAMMKLLGLYTGLPEAQFAMAGYGSFHNLIPDTTAEQNRRIEIYLLPQMKERGVQNSQEDNLAVEIVDSVSNEKPL